MRLKLYILFFIFIALNTNLFAQEAQEQEVKDPFLSLEDKVKLLEKPLDISKLPYPIILNGIIWADNLQLAVLNNEAVEKNQQWRDFWVEDIQREKVVLKLGNNRYEIPLAEEESSEKK